MPDLPLFIFPLHAEGMLLENGSDGLTDVPLLLLCFSICSRKKRFSVPCWHLIGWCLARTFSYYICELSIQMLSFVDHVNWLSYFSALSFKVYSEILVLLFPEREGYIFSKRPDIYIFSCKLIKSILLVRFSLTTFKVLHHYVLPPTFYN